MALAGSLDSTKILAGGAQVKIGTYAQFGVDNVAGNKTFGHTLSPAELGIAFEDFDVETEQSIGRVKTIPVNVAYTLKFDVAQNDAEAMLIATRMAAAQLTASATNLAFTDPSEIYYQIALVGKGYGSTSGTDTYTFWKCQISSIDSIPFGKKAVQHIGITAKIIRDDTVTATTIRGIYGVRVIG